jgi:hypothetical protein
MPPRSEPLPEVNLELGVSGRLPLEVKPLGDTHTSRIVIPRKFLPEGVAKPDEKVGQSSPLRSIVAGVALSAAIAGVFIAARRRRLSPAVLAIGAMAAAWWLASPAIANIGPPPDFLDPKIVIEIVEEGKSVELHLGKTEKGVR